MAVLPAAESDAKCMAALSCVELEKPYNETARNYVEIIGATIANAWLTSPSASYRRVVETRRRPGGAWKNKSKCRHRHEKLSIFVGGAKALATASAPC